MKLAEQVNSWAEKSPSGVILILTPRHLIPLVRHAIPDVQMIDNDVYSQQLTLLQHETIKSQTKVIACMGCPSRLHRAAFLPTMALSLFRNERRDLIIKLVRASLQMRLNWPVGKEITLKE